MIISIIIHLFLLGIIGICIYMFIVYMDTKKIYKQIPITNNTIPAIITPDVVVPPIPPLIKPFTSTNK